MLTSRQFHVDYAGQAVVYMASLPLGVNVLNQVGSAISLPAISLLALMQTDSHGYNNAIRRKRVIQALFVICLYIACSRQYSLRLSTARD